MAFGGLECSSLIHIVFTQLCFQMMIGCPNRSDYIVKINEEHSFNSIYNLSMDRYGTIVVYNNSFNWDKQLNFANIDEYIFLNLLQGILICK